MTQALVVGSITFISGIAGLIYEVIWIRQFGNTFGNTIQSASLVMAVFMCGLGAGSYYIGRRSDLRAGAEPARLLKLYAGLELAIAVLGLLVALVLPQLEVLSSQISQYVRDGHGWYHLSAGSYFFRYAFAVILVGPITLVMGGTLPVLVKLAVREEVAQAGWRVGLIYGVNTAGAAVGCLLVDLVLIPAVGIYSTQEVAVLCNLIAALSALKLSKSRLWSTAQPPPGLPVSAQATSATRSSDGTKLGFTAAALFCAGLVGMGLEVLWFRFLLSRFDADRAILSLLLAAILICIGLGAGLGGFLHRRFGRPQALYMLAQALLIVSAMILFGAYADAPYIPLQGEAGENWRITTLLVELHRFGSILGLVGLPALLMGFSFPLANANVQTSVASVGRRTGALYVGNTLGAVLGSVLGGFFLLPIFGMQASMLVLAVVGAVGLALMYCSSPVGPRMGVSAACFGAIALAVIGWLRLPADHLISKIYPLTATSASRYIYRSEGLTETIAILDTGQERVLMTNGHRMSANGLLAQRYMRMFSHIPLLQLDAPKDVLVICFGVGNTLHAASLHPSVERLEIADLSEHVLNQAHFFNKTNQDVLKDPRVSVFVNDGRQHLRMQPPSRYDLVTLEPPPLAFSGVASLYSEEFYQLVHSRLKPGGYLTQWLPYYQVPPTVLRAMLRAFLNVFPDGVLLAGTTSEFIMLGRKDAPITFEPFEFQRRLLARPEVQSDLKNILAGSLRDVVGAFVGNHDSIDLIAGRSPPVSDDWPVMEYSNGSMIIEPTEGKFNAIADVTTWCPKCFKNGRPIGQLQGLDSYLGILERMYRPSGLHYASGGVMTRELITATIRSSDYLRMVMDR